MSWRNDVIYRTETVLQLESSREPIAFRWLVALALAIALAAPLSAFGQSQCDTLPPGDSDLDGFDDVDECNGIALMEGLGFLDENGETTSFVPSCADTEGAAAFCVDPNVPDLFAIIVRSEPSGLPLQPLSFTAGDPAAGGLGVSVHLVDASDPMGSRQVSAVDPQKAVRITESRDAPGNALGIANYGSPNGIDGSMIWTARIENFVADECGSTGDSCQTESGAQGQADVTEALTLWVLNHEVGHLFALTASYNKRFGGFHVKAGEDEVMTQFVGYNTSKKTGLTTFFIPSTYSDRSRADKLLQ
jgi:hypothetical protein